MTTNIWLKQTWNDRSLTWDPEQFRQIEKLNIPIKKLWTPDIVVFNK